MAKPEYHSPERISWYNRGYSEGYKNEVTSTSNQDYLRGYLAGREQLREDQDALATGEVDHLSESERDFLYGIEEKASHYK